ncbi:MAG: hypothetical protein SNJ50_16990 [Cyanobacteriota bacterium]
MPTIDGSHGKPTPTNYGVVVGDGEGDPVPAGDSVPAGSLPPPQAPNIAAKPSVQTKVTSFLYIRSSLFVGV